MSGTITAITAQKKRTGRVNVYVDGSWRLSLSIRTLGTLQPGDYLSSEKIHALQEADARDHALQRALAYLSARPRSRMEIRRYLERKGFSRPPIEAALARLEAKNYINDREFARMWLENRLRQRPRGVYGLRHELREKGVEESIIDSELEDYDEFAAGRAAISGRLSLWEDLPAPERRRKLYGFLKRRGFSGEACRALCEEAAAADSE
jgi:regulatory protein